MNWTLRTVADANVAEVDLLRQWLREFNWAANPVFMREVQKPENAAQPLVLLAESDGTVIGGLIAETQFAWLKISNMAVDPESRSRGVGTALLAEAERIARERGCRHVYVDTMEYQAPRFYAGRGFKVAGALPNWDSRGHAKLFLIKELEQDGGRGTGGSDGVME